MGSDLVDEVYSFCHLWFLIVVLATVHYIFLFTTQGLDSNNHGAQTVYDDFKRRDEGKTKDAIYANA